MFHKLIFMIRHVKNVLEIKVYYVVINMNIMFLKKNMKRLF